MTQHKLHGLLRSIYTWFIAIFGCFKHTLLKKKKKIIIKNITIDVKVLRRKNSPRQNVSNGNAFKA